MRRLLDGLYFGTGVAGALAIFLIFLLVGIQVSARLIDALMRLAGFRAFGFIVPSIAEICGFLLAAGSFLALPYTLVRGGHIRIGMVVDRLPTAIRRYTEALVGLAATAIAIYAALALGRLTLKSLAFNDVSYGIIPIPLALPQALMTLGLIIFAIAILDVSWRAFARGERLPGAQEV
jgi:TRAP-type C4-dicarboxylate transport system permease small subunit